MTRRTLSNLTLTLAAAVAISMTAVTVAPALTSAGSRNGNPEDFSTNIDNPLFPLSSFETKIFEGEETDPDTGIISTRLESTVLEKTRKVAGIRVLVLEEKAYQDDELIERALDYFAQHSDGTVYYFGEDVDNYVDGKIDNHDGSWRAGKDGAVQGIIMPAAPFVGQAYQQEFAPGIAEDKAMVLALNESVSTPAGDFAGCLKTEDINPLDTPPLIEFKFYCPGVGVVREEAPDGFIELTSYITAEGENATSEQVDDGGDPVSQPAVPVNAETNDGEDDDATEDGGTAESVLSQAANGVAADEAEDEDAEDADEEAGEESGASGQIDDGEELLPLAGIGLDDAITRAQAVVSGPVGEIDLEYFEGKLVFNVEIGDKDVKVDAADGSILSADSED